MTLNQLVSFITVAQFSSFSKAAQHLNIVQSAVSHNVAMLEKELNVQLFVRQKHFIYLTQAGEMLLEDAVKILNLTTVAERKMSIVSKGMAGPLVLGAAFTHSMLPYKDKIVEFMHEHLDIEIKFHSFHINNIRRELVNNVVDAAFIHEIDVIDIEMLEW